MIDVNGWKKLTAFNGSELTIKQLTHLVGGNLTGRMVRHYHQLELLPQPVRSPSNYRLYTQKDVLRLQRIVALKEQGFQLNHIRHILEVEPKADTNKNLMVQLQQQYRAVMQQNSGVRIQESELRRKTGLMPSYQS